MKNLILFGAATLSLVVGAMGCGPSRQAMDRVGQWFDADPGLFANRPQSQTHFIAVVKLASPPLLHDVAGKKDKSLSADRVQQITVEQSEAEAALKEISSEIRVLYRYRMVLNALAVVAPISAKDKIKSAMHVAMIEKEGVFSRPVMPRNSLLNLFNQAPTKWAKNSSAYIGAEALRAQGITGQGLTVGIIDTGIDYTHKMFGGAGTVEAYKAVDPNAAAVGFPSAKVIGGIDLVGSKYDAASGDLSRRIPTPDSNPIDESGHGTHVAGTVAGLGDGVESYTGVAPDARLYAIKVFGAGSTGDSPIIAGLEYAADPNGDGILDDQLDVVNLSLGSDWGSKHLLYGEAVKTLSNAGTVLVISAGNSGNEDYIVGAPGTHEEAISVAASIDDMDHNWKFDAIEFLFANGETKTVEFVEGPISKPIQETNGIRGALVYVGLADKDFSEELKSQLNGKVALIDRGAVTFVEKLKRAEAAGAIAAIVVQNTDEDAGTMGGDGKVGIPAGMIRKDLGTKIKDALALGETVEANLATPEKIERPQKIDTITDFSSKGPRSIDALLKPEITAPGESIVSADVGTGAKGVTMSGTSMAAPHIAGAAALIKQKFAGISSQQVKSLLMGTARLLVDEEQKAYPLTRQGAGRVQLVAAVESGLTLSPEAVSLGQLTLNHRATFQRKIEINNLLARERVLALKTHLKSQFIELKSPSEVRVPANGKVEILVEVTTFKPVSDANYVALEAILDVFEGEAQVQKLPVLAVARAISQVKATGLEVKAGGPEEAAGTVATLNLENKASGKGEVYLFNYLARDEKKIVDMTDPWRGSNCDLEAVGYRIVQREIDGIQFQSLQIVGKLYDSFSTWHLCELNVQIDQNGDGVADQELAAISLGFLPGLAGPGQDNLMASVLLDAGQARAIRKAYEEAAKTNDEATESYADAVLDAIPLMKLDHTSVLMVEAELSKLAVSSSGDLVVKIATTSNEGGNVEADDFLNGGAWVKIPARSQHHAFTDLPFAVPLAAGQSQAVTLTKGSGSGALMAVFPQNLVSEQMKILKPKYLKGN